MRPYEKQRRYLAITVKKKLRWVVLILCILFVLGVWFCIDYPASLEQQIESEFKVSQSSYGLLYSTFAIPNIVMPLVGGVLFDKLGVRYGLILFTAVVCLG